MKSLWIIIAMMPAIIVPSLFFGFELPFYLGLGLIGLAFYLYSNDPVLNFIGSQLSRAGLVLFTVAFMYYFFSGRIFVTEPFEFKFLKAFIYSFLELWEKVANIIGRIVLGRF